MDSFQMYLFPIKIYILRPDDSLSVVFVAHDSPWFLSQSPTNRNKKSTFSIYPRWLPQWLPR